MILTYGGYTAEHHHAGSGIRDIISGELTFIEEGKTTVYKVGDYFYEAGNNQRRLQQVEFSRSRAHFRDPARELEGRIGDAAEVRGCETPFSEMQ